MAQTFFTRHSAQSSNCRRNRAGKAGRRKGRKGSPIRPGSCQRAHGVCRHTRFAHDQERSKAQSDQRLDAMALRLLLPRPTREDDMSRSRATWMAAITTGIMACAATASACPEPVEGATDGARADAPSVARRVVVSIPDRMLALIDGEQVVSIYPIAVGRAGLAGVPSGRSASSPASPTRPTTGRARSLDPAPAIRLARDGLA